MIGNSHITAAIAHERERELRHAAELDRASARSIDDRTAVPVRRRLMERIIGREDRDCTPEPARAAR